LPNDSPPHARGWTRETTPARADRKLSPARAGMDHWSITAGRRCAPHLRPGDRLTHHESSQGIRSGLGRLGFGPRLNPRLDPLEEVRNRVHQLVQGAAGSGLDELHIVTLDDQHARYLHPGAAAGTGPAAAVVHSRFGLPAPGAE